MGGSSLAFIPADFVRRGPVRERYGIMWVLLSLGLSGCESTSEPAQGLAGTWVLRTVAGDPLPALILSGGSPWLVLSDTLEFGVLDPRFASPLARTTRHVGAPGNPTASGTGLYSYVRNGDELRMLYACPPDAICAPDEREGEIRGSTMTLTHVPQLNLPFRSPLVYQRVR